MAGKVVQRLRVTYADGGAIIFGQAKSPRGSSYTVGRVVVDKPAGQKKLTQSAVAQGIEKLLDLGGRSRQ